MTRLALCALVALSACTRKPTLSELNAHPARQLETWKGIPTAPLEERFVYPVPELIFEYMRKDNVFNGYSERPHAVEVDDTLMRDLRAAVAEMPEPVKRLVEKKLVGFFPIAELGGSAYTESVFRGKDREAGAWIAIDVSVLDRNANAWVTWKMNDPWEPDSKHRIEAVIETEAGDNRKNALQYILLHELGHVAPLGRSLVPHWSRGANVAKTGKYTWFNLSWRIEGNDPVSIFDGEFPARAEIRWYRPDRRLPIARALELYEGLEKTSFPTLYGVTTHLEDFSESFASYVHTVMLKRPYEVRVYEGETLRKTYRACWDQPRCAEKRALLEKLLAAP